MLKNSRRARHPLIAVLLILLLAGNMAFASGNGNLDGGGGGMGNGSEENVWYGQDGVRVTVVKTDGTVASTPFDLTNASIPDDIVNFGRVCKLQYNSGTELAPGAGYACSKPGTALPHIVTTKTITASIEQIKRYFCSEYAARLVSDKTGISFESLTGGDYKLIIEPMAYFKFGGIEYAMTATEAALYDGMVGGKLRQKMPSLTHQNLPLAIFLEVPDLGYPAWEGTKTGKVTDDEILSSLGIGIISYAGDPTNDEGSLQPPDYTYHTDTEVITSITLTTNSEINPDHPASATFHINGRDYVVNNIVIPAGGSQVVWAKWRTPSSPCTVPIRIAVLGAVTAKTEFMAKVVSLEDNPPPDPTATDTNPGFSIPSVPNPPVRTSASWSVWSASWHPNWEWESDWKWKSTWSKVAAPCDDTCPQYCPGNHYQWKEFKNWVDEGKWVDNGWYDFTSNWYYASVGASMEVHPDDAVPTASGNEMKSGYGIKELVTASFSANAPASHYCALQAAVTYFPEFNYGTYWRVLSRTDGQPTRFTFKPNEYSTYGRCVHFTPVWFPDGTYAPCTQVLDAWTPAGMLSLTVSDSVTIRDSLFDDWYTKRE